MDWGCIGVRREYRILGGQTLDQAACELFDARGYPSRFEEGLFESENVLGDAGLAPIEVLGGSGVWNPAVELSEIGGQCTGTGGVGAAAGCSQGREREFFQSLSLN